MRGAACKRILEAIRLADDDGVCCGCGGFCKWKTSDESRVENGRYSGKSL